MSSNVTLIGNLTRDPELRFTPSGVAVVNVGMAVNRRWRGQDGEWQEQTSFFDLVVWGDQAEHVAESLQQGARVVASGRLEQRNWETQDGQRRSSIEIRVDEMGPSLRWASAKVNKSQREDDFGGDSGGDNQSTGVNQPSGTPAPAARENYGPDEAPF
ncbi:MAG TPA: single-stranded DNA-binding protein [Acidimicrobiia bacterium]|nr:single-stranded DNA-binding protein [Acidimicrobiia bacterium]